MTPFARISLLSFALAAGSLLLAPAGLGASMAWSVAAFWLVALGRGVASLRLRYFGPVVCRGEGEPPEIAITFDDGPDPAVTPRLLDLLAELEVPALFFCTGERVEQSPELARRIIAEGHLIGNHSYHHGWWTNFLMRRGMVAEIARAQAAIGTATGSRPVFYRPPVGLTNPHLHQALRELDLVLIGWDVRPFDRNAGDPRKVVVRVMRGVRPGSIVLLHDGGVAAEPLLAIVRAVVEGVRARGLRLVRADRFVETHGSVEPLRGD